MKWDNNGAEFEIDSIGKIAFESMKSGINYSIIGITSRGFYTKSSSRWIIYISEESFRSPLTINLKAPDSFWSGISHGMHLSYISGRLLFPDMNIRLIVSKHRIWEIPSPGETKPLKSKRKVGFKIIAEILRRNDGDTQLRELILATLQPSSEIGAPLNGSILSHDTIIQWQESIRTGQIHPLIESVERLLGLGEGLTPSGDDMILGLMLSLNRWKSSLWTGGDLNKLNEYVITKAYEQTTTLSANLIEMACRGISDERLIQVVDALMGVADLSEEMLQRMLQWGDSSGLAALLGCTIAITV